MPGYINILNFCKLWRTGMYLVPPKIVLRYSRPSGVGKQVAYSLICNQFDCVVQDGVGYILLPPPTTINYTVEVAEWLTRPLITFGVGIGPPPGPFPKRGGPVASGGFLRERRFESCPWHPFFFGCAWGEEGLSYVMSYLEALWWWHAELKEAHLNALPSWALQRNLPISNHGRDLKRTTE